ncbi:MAG: hypothetical protein J0I20_11500 [Chloroflexi bacterium]|nr:hypothetical protein [Chloroflexota bacterium]
MLMKQWAKKGWWAALAFTLLLATGFLQGPLAKADVASQTFPETGFTVSDTHGFLSYWQKYGGLAVYGYPITPERQELNPTDGKVYYTQWFERNRFEWHPEFAGTKYEILLGLLGSQLTANRRSEAAFQPVPAVANSATVTYFQPTGHTLQNYFKTYWEQHGGLEQFGYPLTEEHDELNPTDNKVYRVQWFERARFEYHPENQPPYNVLLGLLGRQLFDAQSTPTTPSNPTTPPPASGGGSNPGSGTVTSPTDQLGPVPIVAGVTALPMTQAEYDNLKTKLGAGGLSNLQVGVYTSKTSPDSIAQFYRDALVKGGFKVSQDMKLQTTTLLSYSRGANEQANVVTGIIDDLLLTQAPYKGKGLTKGDTYLMVWYGNN